MLELKQGERARVQAVMAEFQFPFSSKLKIWSVHCIVVVRGLQRNVQKSVMHVQSCCVVQYLTHCFFLSFRCRRRRSFITPLTS